MANRYGNLTPSKKISEDFQNINIGFDRVQADMDANKTAADDHIANADIHVTKAQKAEWDSKASGSTATELTSHIDDQVVHVTQADHDKLDSIEDGAEVNQNAFAKVNDIAAADPSSQFYIVGGVGITVTTNPNNGEVTITATGDATPGAHGSTHTEHGADPIPTATLTEGGLLSAAQLAEIVTHGELLEEQGEAITALETRLNTADTSQLTLQPGLQVVSAAKDARFNLGSIKGKSEINGSGRIGIIGVENPYVIRYGENLLPPFYEWNESAKLSIPVSGKYAMQLVKTSATDFATKVSPTMALPTNRAFTFSVDVDAVFTASGIYGTYLNIFTEDSNGTPSNMDLSGTTYYRNTSGAYTIYCTFTVPSDSRKIWTLIGVDAASTGMFTFKNPMLTLGTEAKPFQPREDSMLAFQTELHANPDTGAEPDVLFEREGQYFKLEKWKKVVLGGSLDWTLHSNLTGYKVVKVNNGRISGFVNNAPGNKYVTKYNGNSIPWVTTSDAAEDAFWNDTNYEGGTFLIKIANTDSGWGDAYTPTVDEIKAYFWGWSMCNQDGSVPYDGNDTKRWKQIGKQGVADTRVLPTSKAPNRDPYNLLYRLAKETIEPVVHEGCLTLSEGDNVVEVGTGIVLRERANPKADAYGNYQFNTGIAGWESTRLKYRVDKLIKVFKNNNIDKWIIENADAYGNQRAIKLASEFDQSAAYSATYLKLDKSPVVPISGVVAANEKAQLSDLTAGVAEALHGVSVLQMKKAEKDAPGLIMPTLLNGWKLYTDPAYAFKGYNKDSVGVVRLFGLITGGVAGAPVFYLPEGYRPAQNSRFIVPVSDGSVGTIDVDTAGRVSIITGITTSGISLTLSFLSA
ncbi:hypothetical protein [Paenibacillus sp. GM2]|uniref:hypothetical protein n=1 Tax=Paenibacillus sp. GM2 TaxID=1622070 RepID=UPI000838A730|nr:hypothetical protein [Paenibacillus sp. GM2]